MPEKPKKAFRCRGSRILGTACGNANNENCERCTKAGFTPQKRTDAIEAEKVRTKDLPADRVKKVQKIRLVD